MKHIIRGITIMLWGGILALMPACGLAQVQHDPDTARAYASTSSAQPGEIIAYTLEAEVSSADTVEFPAPVTMLAGFRVKNIQRLDDQVQADRRHCAQRYELQTFTAGPYVIPAQAIVVRAADGRTHTLDANEVFIDIQPAAGTDDDGALRDIKPPVPLARAWLRIMLLAGAIALLVLGIGQWLRRRNARRIPAVKPLLPHERALRELDAIEQLRLAEQGMVKEYYYRVNTCLRRYLEERFALRAPEQTTEEFLKSVRDNPVLLPEQLRLLEEYLQQCDMVKYAALMPAIAESVRLMQLTRKFIAQSQSGAAAQGDEQ